MRFGSSCPGLSHGRPARKVLEEVHGIDSARVQVVTNHLDPRKDQAVRQHNIVLQELLKHVPWQVLDDLVEQYGAEPDPRGLKTKAHLIALLLAQFHGMRGLREIETSLRSHAGKLHHLRGCTVSRS